MQLTIFQKMLLAPLLAMALFCGYLVISYLDHREASRTVESIRDRQLPTIAIANENIFLFESIVTQIKDAVLAGESNWLHVSQSGHDRIIANLEQLKSFDELLDPASIDRSRHYFTQYYDNAVQLSQVMLGEQSVDTRDRNELVEAVERYHNLVAEDFQRIRDNIHQRVNQSVDRTNRGLNALLLKGIVIALLLLLLVAGLTFALSMNTRNSLSRIIQRMRDLAQGKPDFSQRLEQEGKDELSALAGWFNQLSDKLEQDYKQIELLSITDKLTQLYNRTKIDQLFNAEVARAKRYEDSFSVIMIDLDHFKSVNDEHGHQVGDQVLQRLASIIKSNVREIDHVGRWGGEEFIVICPKTDLSQATKLAEKLCQTIRQIPFPDVGYKTASFGVAEFRPTDSEDTLTQRADEALYQAKQKGRDQVVAETASDPVSCRQGNE